MKKVVSSYWYHGIAIQRSPFPAFSRVGPKPLEIKVALAVWDGGLYLLLTQLGINSLE